MATIGMRGSLVRPLVTALRRALVESSGFTPLSLFSQGEQGAWYDPSDLSTLFQDSAGTVPVVADGDPVGLMLDKSGNGNHATQSVAVSRPIYRTDGVLHWIEADGVDDWMFTQTFAITTQSRMTISAVNVKAVSGVFFLNKNNLSVGGDLELVSSDGIYTPNTRSGGTSFLQLSTENVLNRTVVTSSKVNVNIFSASVDQSNELSTTLISANPTSANLAVGGFGGSSLNSQCDFFGAVNVYGIPKDEFNTSSYIAAKAGVVL